MTAVVAQMTREKRERKLREKHCIVSDPSKCYKSLAPFDSHFEPEIHNKFMAGQAQDRQFNKLRLKALQVQKKKKAARIERNTKMWWSLCVFEGLVIGKALSLLTYSFK